MSGIPQWALTAAVRGILKDAQKDGKVESLTNSLNELIGAFFPDKTKEVKEELVKMVILPISKGLVGEEAFVNIMRGYQ